MSDFMVMFVSVLVFISVFLGLLAVLVVRRLDFLSFQKEKMRVGLHSNSRKKVILPFDYDKISRKIGMAGLDLSVESYYIGKILIASVTFLLGYLFFRDYLFSFLLTIIGYFILDVWLAKKTTSREIALRDQFPEFLQKLSNFIKAGVSFNIALEEITKLCNEPIKTELLLILSDIKKTKSISEAIKKATQKRIPISEFNLFLIIVTIQHEGLGGNMPKSLENLASTIKDRKKLTDMMKAQTTENRISGYFIAGVPLFLFIGIKAFMPEYIDLALNNPIGRIMYFIAGILVIIGVFVVYKISDVSKETKDLTEEEIEEAGDDREGF